MKNLSLFDFYVFLKAGLRTWKSVKRKRGECCNYRQLKCERSGEKVRDNFEVEEKDYELLKTRVPEDPCRCCHNQIGCCGCDENRKRQEIIKSLKQAGIFEIQQKVQEVEELQREVVEMEEAIEADKNFIVNCGFDLDRIFPKNNDGDNEGLAKINAFQ